MVGNGVCVVVLDAGEGGAESSMYRITVLLGGAGIGVLVRSAVAGGWRGLHLCFVWRVSCSTTHVSHPSIRCSQLPWCIPSLSCLLGLFLASRRVVFVWQLRVCAQPAQGLYVCMALVS